MEKLEFVLYRGEKSGHNEVFFRLFSDYFDEIFCDKPEDNIPKKYLPKILSVIADETKKYTIWLYMCVCGGLPAGFVIAQIDAKENPLCKREGWGFIREFYIAPPFRRRGCAKQMCGFIESVILQNGSEKIYLTASPKTGVPFWEAMGYIFSGKTDDKNGNRIYEKRFPDAK